MKFNKHQIEEYLRRGCTSGYSIMEGCSNTGTGLAEINYLFDEITVDVDLINDMPAYIYEPSMNSWEICDESGRDGKPDSERFKFHEKMTAYFEKQNMEQQIAKQPETPRIKMKI